MLNDAGYATMINTTTRLNKPGAQLSTMPGVGAITDVTGFGLLGHLLEVARASNLTARLNMSAVPLLDQVSSLAEQGCITGASARNWAAYGNDVTLAQGIGLTQRHILCDPQTSGGLLVSAHADVAAEVLKLFHHAGFTDASIIGELTSAYGATRINVAP
jgi:selenide,water dikinase